MSAMEAPTATPLPELELEPPPDDPWPLLSPEPFVWLAALSAVAALSPAEDAVTDTSPPAVSKAPEPIRAVVVWDRVLIATTASTAVPPLAPPLAVTWVSILERASTVTEAAPPTEALFPIKAALVDLNTLSATEAPTPTFEPSAPPSAGKALAATKPTLSA